MINSRKQYTKQYIQIHTFIHSQSVHRHIAELALQYGNGLWMGFWGAGVWGTNLSRCLEVGHRRHRRHRSLLGHQRLLALSTPHSPNATTVKPMTLLARQGNTHTPEICEVPKLTGGWMLKSWARRQQEIQRPKWCIQTRFTLAWHTAMGIWKG